MDDFLELGMEGVDKMVDKKFDRIPDKYLHSDTYKPRRRHKRNSTQSNSVQDSEEGYQEDNKPRRRSSKKHNHTRGSSVQEAEEGFYEAKPRRSSKKHDSENMQNQDGSAAGGTYLNYNANPNYTPNPVPNYGAAEMANVPVYSHEPPHQRAQYTPYYPPSDPPRHSEPYREFEDRRSRGRGRRDSSSSSSGYESERPTRRRPVQRRRSSSYHGPSSRGADLTLAKRSGSSHTGVRDQVKDKAHRYNVKGEIDELFSSSKKGLTGAAVGAVVGGWAAHKAQEANKRGNGHSNNLLTLLGAAAGGIVADVGVGKWETSHGEAEKREEKWEKKFGTTGGTGRASEVGGRSRRGSRERVGRRRRDSYSSDEEYYRR
jgi:hypothetical protein